MKKYVVILVVISVFLLSVPAIAQDQITLESLQAQIDELRAEIETLKNGQSAVSTVAESAPTASQTVITQEGFYAVPSEMPYGNWTFQSSDPNNSCPITLYSSLDSNLDNMINFINTNNKGYFVIGTDTKMVELTHYSGVSCTWSWIGE